MILSIFALKIVERNFNICLALNFFWNSNGKNYITCFHFAVYVCNHNFLSCSVFYVCELDTIIYKVLFAANPYFYFFFVSEGSTFCWSEVFVDVERKKLVIEVVRIRTDGALTFRIYEVSVCIFYALNLQRHDAVVSARWNHIVRSTKLACKIKREDIAFYCVWNSLSVVVTCFAFQVSKSEYGISAFSA